MIRTGIFGGSFNPIHNGHLRIAEYFFEKARLDELWFVVSPQNPFKVNTDLLDDNTRLELTRTAVADFQDSILKQKGIEFKFMVSDIEFHLSKPSYMINTLKKIKTDNPDHQPVLLIGGDNWDRFHHWYQHEKIEAEYEIFVYPRGEAKEEIPLIDISSTGIRERIKKGQAITGLVPESIEARCLQLFS